LLNTFWVNHTSTELIWEQLNFTVGGCDSHLFILPPLNKSRLVR
jgi:hypothetical protein